MGNPTTTDDQLGAALVRLADRPGTPPVIRDWLRALARGDDGGSAAVRKKVGPRTGTKKGRASVPR